MSGISTWATEHWAISMMTADEGSAAQTWRKVSECKSWGYTNNCFIIQSSHTKVQTGNLKEIDAARCWFPFLVAFQPISCHSVHLSRVYGMMKEIVLPLSVIGAWNFIIKKKSIKEKIQFQLQRDQFSDRCLNRGTSIRGEKCKGFSWSWFNTHSSDAPPNLSGRRK